MSNSIPTNALDKAIMSLQRSNSATPDFYRHLAEGELWFLVPYHPEIEGGVLELKNGAPLPFSRIKDEEGQVVPLFSSEERATEGLTKARVPAKTFSLASMPAQQVLQILGHVGLRAVLNKACATGTIVVSPELMRDLASGKALKPLPMGAGETKQVTLSILNPADYPTSLIQPIFELVRKHRNFRAAWVFGPPAGAAPTPKKVYYILVLMDPRDQALFHDFNMVVQAASGTTYQAEMSLADEKDSPHIATLFKQAPPFYVATDYRPPSV
jgi:hypothetical protein